MTIFIFFDNSAYFISTTWFFKIGKTPTALLVRGTRLQCAFQPLGLVYWSSWRCWTVIQSARALSPWKLNSHRLPVEVLHVNTEHEPSFISIKRGHHHGGSQEPRKTQYVSVCDWFSTGTGRRSSASPEATGTGCGWQRKFLPRAPVLGWGQALVCRWEVEGSGLLPSTLRKVVPLPQMNHGDFYSCARWQGGFFRICNLSQAPKAVRGNCFEIYSITFHNFHGNLKSFWSSTEEGIT